MRIDEPIGNIRIVGTVTPDVFCLVYEVSTDKKKQVVQSPYFQSQQFGEPKFVAALLRAMAVNIVKIKV